MLLLGLLSTLAVMALQATSLELQMTGNEQYRLRALAAAEAGLALASNAILRRAAGAAGAAPPDLPRTAMPETPGDFYRTEIRYVGADLGIAERSGGAEIGTHYSLHGWGESVRGASVELETGLLVIRDAGGHVIAARRSYWRRCDVE